MRSYGTTIAVDVGGHRVLLGASLAARPVAETPDIPDPIDIRPSRPCGGAMRVVREENGKAAFAAVTHHVDRKAVVVTDEHPSYADIVARNEHRQVSHSEAYSAEDGVNTNHVESFFSRVQRSYVGIHHHFSLKYFGWYAADLAWSEDSRRRGNRWLTAAILMVATQAPTSRNLCGYWQGNSPPEPDFADVTEPFKPI